MITKQFLKFVIYIYIQRERKRKRCIKFANRKPSRASFYTILDELLYVSTLILLLKLKNLLDLYFTFLDIIVFYYLKYDFCLRRLTSKYVCWINFQHRGKSQSYISKQKACFSHCVLVFSCYTFDMQQSIAILYNNLSPV